jgi:hypothetical protein
MTALQSQRKTLEGLLTSGNTQESPDIAEINLLCAAELPGSQSLDIDAALARIDEMAQRVKFEIRRNWHRFLTNPGQADNSRAKYCVMMMVTVLQQDFGVHYNPDRIRNPDFRDAGDLFIHGMLGGNGGTCASMPVLYTAVGRRLGWPIKMVHARAHLFCRWDDPEGQHPYGKERFNLEATGQGANFPTDDYYRTWPEPLSDEMIDRLGYLNSISPEKEFADFLVLRGHCLEDNGWIGKACDAYRAACQFTPNDLINRAFWEHAESVRQHFIEQQTLLDYFGPDVPLPFGYFPRHVLQHMAVEMAMADCEYTNRMNALERERQEARFQSQMQMARPNARGAAHRWPGAPVYPASPFPPIHNPMGQMGVEMPGFPHSPDFGGVPSTTVMPPFIGIGSPFSSFPNPNVGSLPAKLLRTVDPGRLMQRCQEAVAICRSLPPGAVIKQPNRMLLTPTQSKQNITAQEN